jgi:sugar phosphate isomerase/epimerase
MRHVWSRREFLGVSAGMAAGLAATSVLPKSAVAADAKKIYASCRDVCLQRPGNKDCWEALKQVGAEGVEVEISEKLTFPQISFPAAKAYTAETPEGIEDLKKDAAAAGQKLTAFLMHNQFGGRPDFEVEWCTKAAKVAQALGVKAIRIDVVPHNIALDKFVDLAGDAIKKILANTESMGVSFGVENHGLANNPEFLKPLFERVNSPRFGWTFDTGNFYWYGLPRAKIYELCEMYAPRIIHTHCKSIKYPEDKRDVQREMGWKYGELCCPIYEGDIDFRRIVDILKKAGYSNDLCIEDESLSRFPEAERAGIVKKEIEYLKGLLA